MRNKTYHIAKRWSVHRFSANAGRCQGPGMLLDAGNAEAPLETFKDDAPGFLHMDIDYPPQMPDEGERSLPIRGHRPRHGLGVHAHLHRSS